MSFPSSKQRAPFRCATFLFVSCWLVLGVASWAADGDGNNKNVTDFYVSEALTPYVLDVDLRNLPRAKPWEPGDPIVEIEEGLAENYGIEPDPNWVDPVRQGATEGGGFSTTLGVSFPGIPFSGFRPPDTAGDVGPNHYILMANASLFEIRDKQGNVLVPVTDLDALWTGTPGSACAAGLGDPIVQYDELADRWIMSEFASTGNHFCIYISQGPDPVNDGWFVYDFNVARFPDYPKYGVWLDGYFVSTFDSAAGNLLVYAFDRTAMLSGSAATFQTFTISALNGSASRVTRILPADADGIAPPAGEPNVFVRTVDATQDSSDPTDRLEIWEFDVDFATPGNSSFTQTQTLLPAPFTLLPCSPGTRDCVPQPGTTNLIDALFNRALRRLQYRNFGSHESMVTTQVVDAGGGVAGKRWWELRRTGGGAWTIYQEGTYAPDSSGRFMGSMAMNAAGNIALGYTVSDAVSVFPGIRATARREDDPLGVMTLDELTIADGIGSQISSQRWGDYSSMNVDPSDNLTFWYTNQIIDGAGQWLTYVGSFNLGGLFVDGFESGDTLSWSNTTP